MNIFKPILFFLRICAHFTNPLAINSNNIGITSNNRDIPQDKNYHLSITKYYSNKFNPVPKTIEIANADINNTPLLPYDVLLEIEKFEEVISKEDCPAVETIEINEYDNSDEFIVRVSTCTIDAFNEIHNSRSKKVASMSNNQESVGIDLEQKNDTNTPTTEYEEVLFDSLAWLFETSFTNSTSEPILTTNKAIVKQDYAPQIREGFTKLLEYNQLGIFQFITPNKMATHVMQCMEENNVRDMINKKLLQVENRGSKHQFIIFSSTNADAQKQIAKCVIDNGSFALHQIIVDKQSKYIDQAIFSNNTNLRYLNIDSTYGTEQGRNVLKRCVGHDDDEEGPIFKVSKGYSAYLKGFEGLQPCIVPGVNVSIIANTLNIAPDLNHHIQSLLYYTSSLERHKGTEIEAHPVVRESVLEALKISYNASHAQMLYNNWLKSILVNKLKPSEVTPTLVKILHDPLASSSWWKETLTSGIVQAVIGSVVGVAIPAFCIWFFRKKQWLCFKITDASLDSNSETRELEVNLQTTYYSDRDEQNQSILTPLLNSDHNAAENRQISKADRKSLQSTTNIAYNSQTDEVTIPLSDDFAALRDGAKPIDNKRASSNDARKFISEEYIQWSLEPKLNSMLINSQVIYDTESEVVVIKTCDNFSNADFL